MAILDARGFDFGRGANQEARDFTSLLSQKQGVQGREMALQQERERIARQEQVRAALSGIGQPQQTQAATQQDQMIAEQSAGLGGALAAEEQIAAQPEPLMSREEMIETAKSIDPGEANKQLKLMGFDDASKRADASRESAQIQSLPFGMRAQAIQERAQKISARGGDPKDTLELLDMNEQEQNNALTGIQLLDLSTKERLGFKSKADRSTLAGASEREFENLIKDFSPKEKEEARRVKAGITGRATGSAAQTIAKEGTAEQVGESSAIIKQREKFGEMTGASRAKTIDKGFEKLVKIDLGIRNIDKAIQALDDGANTGVMQNFSPSIKAASIALDNVRNNLALDVLNAATFGALSEKELDIVKETALPTKLSPPELRVWLQDRKTAELKLKDYYQEQIDHLDQGGTVASFLRKKRRNTKTPETTQEAPQDAAKVGRFTVEVE